MPPSGGQRGEVPRGHKPTFSAFLLPLYTETEERGKKHIRNKRLRLTYVHLDATVVHLDAHMP